MGMRRVGLVPGNSSKSSGSFFRGAAGRKSLRSAIREQLDFCSSVVMGDMMGLKRGERVLIITNPGDTRKISGSLKTATEGMGGSAEIVVERPKIRTVAEPRPPAERHVIDAILRKPDIVLMVMVKDAFIGGDMRGEESPYLGEASRSYKHAFGMFLGEKVGRGAWANSIDLGSFLRTTNVDYEEMKAVGGLIVGLMREHGEARVVNWGKEFRLTIKEGSPRVYAGPYDKPGTGGNIPEGEAYSEIVEANGTLVFDGAVETRSRRGTILPSEPIVVEVRRGNVVGVSGADSEDLLMTLSDYSPGPMEETFVEEFSLGLNQGSRMVDLIIESEKKFGGAHVSLRKGRMHLDCCMDEPAVWIGGRKVIDRGRLLL